MKKFRFVIYVLLTCSIFSLLQGWDANEIETLAIVTGIGIDTGENESDINVILQVADTSKAGKQKEGGEASSTIIFEQEGVNIQQTIESIRLKNTRTPYFSHNKVILFSEEQAKKGITSVMDWFLRNEYTRLEIIPFVTRGNSKDLLSVKSNQENITAYAINEMVRTEINMTNYSQVSILNHVSKYMSKSQCGVFPLIKKSKDKDDNEFIEFDGFAIFKKGSMVGDLDVEETRGFLWTTGNITNSSIVIKTDEGSASLDISNSKSTITPTITENNLKTMINIDAEMNISELNGFNKFKSNDELISFIKENSINTIKEKVFKCYEKSKSYKADILDLATSIFKKNPKEFDEVKDKWDEIYSSSNVEININVSIKNSGKINRIISGG